MLPDHHHDPPPVVVLQNGYDALRDFLRRGDSAGEGRIGPLIRKRVLGAFLSKRCKVTFRFELRESCVKGGEEEGKAYLATHVSDHRKVPRRRHERLVGAVEVGADKGDGAAIAHLSHARDALCRYVGA